MVKDVAAILGALFSAGMVLSMVGRLRPLKWAYRRLVTIPFTEWTHATVGSIVSEQLAPFEAELRPNGGGSIKDHVTKTSRMVTDLGKRLDDHIQADAEVQATLTKKLDELVAK